MTPARQTTTTRLGIAVATVALIAIGVATLTPEYGTTATASYGCIVCGERGVADAILNVILFAPLGAGLALAGVRVRRAVLAGALASGLVECAQLSIIAGRDASIGDVLFNTVGTACGFAFVWLVTELMDVDRSRAAWLSLIAALGVAVAVLLTGWLLQPSFPHTEYWGQWTANLAHLEWYRGRIQTGAIAGREVRSRHIEDSRWARRALLEGDTIDVHFTAGPSVPGLAPLFSIYDANQKEIFLVGTDRDDLVLRYRTHSTALRLDQPDLRVLHGWRHLTEGSAYEVRVWSPSPGQWCSKGPTTSQCDLGFTAGSAWGILFYAEHFPEWVRRLLSIGWIAGLLLPVGYFLRPRWESAAAVAVAIAALGALPALVHLRPTPPEQWGGAVLGLAVGMLGAWGARVARGARVRNGSTRTRRYCVPSK